jgi:hypothetical protein
MRTSTFHNIGLMRIHAAYCASNDNEACMQTLHGESEWLTRLRLCAYKITIDFPKNESLRSITTEWAI